MTERINITVPSDLLVEIDSAASREHLTRSGFLRAAARDRIERTGSAARNVTAHETAAVYAPGPCPGAGGGLTAHTWPPSRERVLATLQAFFAARDDVAAAYLFGSAAIDGASEKSDIDVAVLFGDDVEPDARLGTQLELAGRIGAVFGSDRIDVVALDEAPPHLVAAVLAEGIVVAGGQSSRRMRFEQTARAAAAGHDRELEDRWLRFSERIARESDGG